MSDQARTALEGALKLEHAYDFEGAKKKLYYPQLNDTVIEIIGRGEMIP